MTEDQEFTSAVGGGEASDVRSKDNVVLLKEELVAIDRALSDYFDAFDQGDQARVSQITTRISNEPELSKLFLQRIDEMRVNDKRALEIIMNSELERVRSLANSFFQGISETPRSFHILNPRVSAGFAQPLSNYVAQLREADNLGDFQRTVLRVEDWQEKFTRATASGLRLAQEAAGRDSRAQNILSMERTQASSLVQSVKELVDATTVTKSKLRS